MDFPKLEKKSKGYGINYEMSHKLQKNLFPENYVGSSIIKNSRFSEVLLDAAIILNQLTTGLEYVSEHDTIERKNQRFEYPHELQEIGLVSLS